MSYVIEKDIPIPPATSRYSGVLEVMRQMEVGDSILIGDMNASAVNGKIAYAKRAGIAAKFSIRKQEVGIRVWRIA